MALPDTGTISHDMISAEYGMSKTGWRLSADGGPLISYPSGAPKVKESDFYGKAAGGDAIGINNGDKWEDALGVNGYGGPSLGYRWNLNTSLTDANTVKDAKGPLDEISNAHYPRFYQYQGDAPASTNAWYQGRNADRYYAGNVNAQACKGIMSWIIWPEGFFEDASYLCDYSLHTRVNKRGFGVLNAMNVSWSVQVRPGGGLNSSAANLQPMFVIASGHPKFVKNGVVVGGSGYGSEFMRWTSADLGDPVTGDWAAQPWHPATTAEWDGQYVHLEVKGATATRDDAFAGGVGAGRADSIPTGKFNDFWQYSNVVGEYKANTGLCLLMQTGTRQDTSNNEVNKDWYSECWFNYLTFEKQ